MHIGIDISKYRGGLISGVLLVYLEEFGGLKELVRRMVVILVIQKNSLQELTLLSEVSHQPSILLLLGLA